jgi:nucleoside-diphosphate-sugar epimerase
MKFLIVGGTGLISTAITRLLLEKGEDVTLYNRGTSEARIPVGAKQIQGDRTQYSVFEAQIQEAGTFDVVIDMICYTPEDAQSAVRALSGRTGQLIFCSTVDVYSKPGVHMPYREDEPRNAITEYGRNKVKCENILLQAHAHGNFKVTIIRPAATYGEGGKIIHSFGWSTTYLDRLRKGKPIVVHGDGNSLWVMCHIDDVARAFIAAAGNSKTHGRAYHTTGEEWMSWNQFHRTVAIAMGAPPPKLVHIPTDLLYRLAPQRAEISYGNFQYSNVYDNSAAKSDLNFRYTIPFLEGARRTIAWLDARNLILNSDEDPFDDRLIAAWEQLAGQMANALKER